MKVLVFVKEGIDVRVPVARRRETGRLRDEWNVPQTSPDDVAAMGMALRIREEMPDTSVTLVHLGPAAHERLIREGLAAGCDRSVRVWADGLEAIHTEAKAFILARASRILGFDLLLAGERSADTGSGQLGILLASFLDIPCVSRVTGVRTMTATGLVATRSLDRGSRAIVECRLPLVATVEGGDRGYPCASLPALLAAEEAEIATLDLETLGIPAAEIRRMESRLAFGPLRPRTPNLQPAPAPDSSLPAFERISALVKGSMTTREGSIVDGDEDEVVEEMFQTLLQEGWLDHLRKRSPEGR